MKKYFVVFLNYGLSGAFTRGKESMRSGLYEEPPALIASKTTD